MYEVHNFNWPDSLLHSTEDKDEAIRVCLDERKEMRDELSYSEDTVNSMVARIRVIEVERWTEDGWDYERTRNIYPEEA